MLKKDEKLWNKKNKKKNTKIEKWINYNVKTTIQNPFDLKTEKRSKTNKREKDLNIIKKKE